MVEAWEKEGYDECALPNPYELPKSGLTQKDVQLKLAEAEAAERSSGAPLISDVSPSSFVILGLEVEDLQFVHFLHLPLHC